MTLFISILLILAGAALSLRVAAALSVPKPEIAVSRSSLVVTVLPFGWAGSNAGHVAGALDGRLRDLAAGG